MRHLAAKLLLALFKLLETPSIGSFDTFSKIIAYLSAGAYWRFSLGRGWGG